MNEIQGYSVNTMGKMRQVAKLISWSTLLGSNVLFRRNFICNLIYIEQAYMYKSCCEHVAYLLSLVDRRSRPKYAECRVKRLQTNTGDLQCRSCRLVIGGKLYIAYRLNNGQATIVITQGKFHTTKSISLSTFRSFFYQKSSLPRIRRRFIKQTVRCQDNKRVS